VPILVFLFSFVVHTRYPKRSGVDLNSLSFG
jgi:hypothetical protein